MAYRKFFLTVQKAESLRSRSWQHAFPKAPGLGLQVTFNLCGTSFCCLPCFAHTALLCFCLSWFSLSYEDIHNGLGATHINSIQLLQLIEDLHSHTLWEFWLWGVWHIHSIDHNWIRHSLPTHLSCLFYIQHCLSSCCYLGWGWEDSQVIWSWNSIPRYIHNILPTRFMDATPVHFSFP